jgi:hypothetical protein
LSIVPFQPPTFLFNLSKILIDDAPGGFGNASAPADEAPPTMR